VSVSEFHLREAGTTPLSKQEAELQDLAQTLEARAAELEARQQMLYEKGLSSRGALEAQAADLSKKLAAAREKAGASSADAIIDTSFRMDVGETVVVGTSRLQGDKALIVLVTAVGK
jgi:hypothetical protein